MGLRDKASKIDFSTLQAVRPVAAPGIASDRRPKTAPGEMMAGAADQRSELLRENDELRAKASASDSLRQRLEAASAELKEWDGAKATRLLDPARIRRSRFSNRHERSFEGPEFAALKEEIASAGGNVQPVKVRPVKADDGGGDYELVFGHRRHQACLELGLPLLALVDNIDDRGLFIEMERENRARADLKPYEQGVMYRRALDEGLFPSNRKLAEACGVDLGSVGKALSLAQLPDFVLKAFRTPLELQYRWAKPLSDAVAGDRALIQRRAEQIVADVERGLVFGAKAVFDRLLGLTSTNALETTTLPAPRILKQGERVIGTLEFVSADSAVLKFAAGVIGPTSVDALEQALQPMLQEPTTRAGG